MYANQSLQGLYPISKIGNKYLLILKTELPKVGKQLGVLSVKIDLSRSEITTPIDLEKHLKFNPWEEITDSKEREEVIVNIQKQFDITTIEEQIINPLIGIKGKIFVSSLLKKNQDFYFMFL